MVVFESGALRSESSNAVVVLRKSPSMATRSNSCNSNKTSSSSSSSSTTTPCSHRKVKSTVGLCVGILFCTVVLFVLVSLDPAKVSEDPRILVTFPYRIRSHSLLSKAEDVAVALRESEEDVLAFGSPALEGLGMLFRKGKCAMPELVVAHLSESTTPAELRFFLRGLHRSGTPARADVVLLFPWRPLSPAFLAVIQEEERYFRRLLSKSRTGLFMSVVEDAKLSVFHSGAYTHALLDDECQSSIWGRNDTAAATTRDAGDRVDGQFESVQFGAIVGFDMLELDPDDTLRGFLDSSPAMLRRWLCYQILLGMVRHRYRQVLVTEVSGVFILRDALSLVAPKKKDCSLHLFYTGQLWSDRDGPAVQTDLRSRILPNVSAPVGVMEHVYGKSFWNSLDEDDKAGQVISTGVIMGGTRQVRHLATAMATEIVRVALLRRSRVPCEADSPLLSFLVLKSSVLGKKVARHLQIYDNGAGSVNLLPGAHSHAPSAAPPQQFEFFRRSDHIKFAILHGLNHPGAASPRRDKIMRSLRRDICLSHRDTEIYTDCYDEKALRASQTAS